MTPDSNYVSVTSLKTIHAALHESSVRLDVDSATSAVLTIHDGKQFQVLRLNFSTLICLEFAMAQFKTLKLEQQGES